MKEQLLEKAIKHEKYRYDYNSSSSSCGATNMDFPDFLSLSHTICLYYPSLLAGSLDYILCPYRAVVDMFYMLVHVKRSTGKCRLSLS